MNALDICCGLGGMTEGMLSVGFQVHGIDVEPTLAGRYPARLTLGDIRTMDPASLGPADWIHASPPCTRFSTVRANRTTDPPTEADLDILQACLRVIQAIKPRFWSIENVAGAVPWFRPVLGEPILRHGPFRFWGNFPPHLAERSNIKKPGWVRSPVHGRWIPARGRNADPRVRAKLPIEITRPMAQAVASALQPVFAIEDGAE